MNTFTLYLQDAVHRKEIADAVSFVGEDESGSFGILPGHAPFMTSLVFGLSRFRRAASGKWTFIAAPRALVYFKDNQLHLSTRRYLLDDDYERISRDLQERLVAEESRLNSIKSQLHHLEQEMFKRLSQMQRDALTR